MSKKCSFCNKWLVAGKCSVCPKPVATVVEEEVVESKPPKAVETTESKPKVESNEKVDYESEFQRLKTEIGEATKNQAFERAVELRDELRALEKRKEEEDAAAAAAKEAHNDDSSSSDDSELANELSIEQQRANILAQLDEAKADQNFELCLELKQQLEALTSNNDGEDDEENSSQIDTTNETTNPSIEEQCQELRKQLEIAKANQEFEVCLQLKQQIEQLQKSNEKTTPPQQQQQPSNQNTPPPIPSSAPPPKPTAPPPATLSIDSKPEVPKSAPPPIPSSAPPPKSQLTEAVPYEEDNTPTRRRKSRRRKDSDRVDKPNRTESSRRRAEKESDINDIISPRSRKIKSHRSSRSHRQDPSQTATKSPVAQAREEAEALERLQLERALSGASEETSKPKFKSDDLLRQKCVELERDIAKLESAPPDDTDAQLKLWDAQTALRAVQAELAGVNDADELDDAPNTPASPLNNGEKTVSNDNAETPLSPKINSNTANSSLNSSPAASTSITKRPSRPMLKKTGNTKQLVPRPKVDNASQIKQPNAEDVYMSGWLTSKRQKRYLVLQGKVLYWFKLEQTQIPVEQLRANAQKYVLIHSQSIDAPHDKPTLLQLGAADPAEKPYEFTAPSNEIRDKWHDALCLAQRVRLSGDELPAKSEHSKGKFNTFKKKLFRKKEGEEVKGRDIGIVTGVKHTGHAGFDASKGKFDTRGLPPQLQELFDSVEKALASAGATGIPADEAKEILKMAAKDPTLLQKLDEDAAAQQSDDVAVTPSNDVQTTDVSNNNNNSEQVAVVANNTNNSNGDVARESRREKRRQEKRAEFERKKLAKLAEREKRRKERAMKKMMAFSEADAKANNNNATNQTAAGNDDDDEESTDDSATEEYDAMVLDDSDESSSYIEEAQPSQQPSSTNDTDTSTAVVDATEATPANNESTQHVEQSSPAATPPVTAPPAPAPPKQPIASVTPKKQTPSGGLGGDLLSAIRAGTDLKKVEAGSNKPVKSGGGIGDMIAQALLERRKALVVKDTTADDEDSDSDWD